MGSEHSEVAPSGAHVHQSLIYDRASHARIVAIPDGARCLDAVQLNKLEQSFRAWVEDSPRRDVRQSRRRILLIFLLIRYAGAKLNEVLALDPFRDIDFSRRVVTFGKGDAGGERMLREVHLPEPLSAEVQAALDDPAFRGSLNSLFRVDPAHVRRKFYDRAVACGFPQELGAPEAIRKSRAVELLQNNVPLPVVQKILGHSTLDSTASFVEFSDDDIREVARRFAERESHRKTSARNTFFGKIHTIRRGDIQSKVELITLGGDLVTTVITTNSLARLGLKVGALITAEVKASLVTLQKGDQAPECTAENRFRGNIERVVEGEVTTEYVVRIADGTELCSIVTGESSRRLGLREGDVVWATFNSFSVVLHVD